MRFFNTAGPCDPDRHYMLPPERRLPGVRDLIDRQLYFVLHAPRQTGKTTCCWALAQSLTADGRYVALYVTCEKGQPAGGDIERGVRAVLRDLEKAAQMLPPELRPPSVDSLAGIEAESLLDACLTAWSEQSPLPV